MAKKNKTNIDYCENVCISADIQIEPIIHSMAKKIKLIYIERLLWKRLHSSRYVNASKNIF
jgi:hypothetical protein